MSKGAIPPHLPESNEQNLVVIEAFLEAAKRYVRGGYDVIVDIYTDVTKELKRTEFDRLDKYFNNSIA